jgi:hypothetical protein
MRARITSPLRSPIDKGRTMTKDKRPVLVVSYKHYQQIIKHFGSPEKVPYKLEPSAWYDESKGNGFNVDSQKYETVDNIIKNK